MNHEPSSCVTLPLDEGKSEGEGSRRRVETGNRNLARWKLNAKLEMEVVTGGVRGTGRGTLWHHGESIGG